jgi:hypothetical protein
MGSHLSVVEKFYGQPLPFKYVSKFIDGDKIYSVECTFDDFDLRHTNRCVQCARSDIGKLIHTSLVDQGKISENLHTRMFLRHQHHGECVNKPVEPIDSDDIQSTVCSECETVPEPDPNADPLEVLTKLGVLTVYYNPPFIRVHKCSINQWSIKLKNYYGHDYTQVNKCLECAKFDIGNQVFDDLNFRGMFPDPVMIPFPDVLYHHVGPCVGEKDSDYVHSLDFYLSDN